MTLPEASGGIPLLTFTMDLHPGNETVARQPEAQWFFNVVIPEMIYYTVNHVKEIIESNHPRFTTRPMSKNPQLVREMFL